MSAATSGDPNAGAPVQKTVDMAVPPNANAAPVETPVNTDGKEPDLDKGSAGSPPAAPAPTHDPLAAARAKARRQAQANAEREAIQREAQRQAYAAREAQAYLQQERAARQDLEAKYRAVTGDPAAALEHLEKLGLDPKTLAKKALEADTPEAKLRAEIRAEFQAELEAIKRENQERLEAERKAQLVAQQERTRQEAHQRFIAQASDATAFPTLASMFEKNPRWKGQIISEATQILREAKQKTGEDYSNKQVLLYLEEKYSEITPSRNGAVTREDTGKTTPGTATTAGGSRTLTNDATQVRGTLPPDFDSLSDAEQKKALAALYRQTSRK